MKAELPEGARITLLAALGTLVVGVAGACGDASARSEQSSRADAQLVQAPRTIGLRHDGRTFRLAPGRSVTIRLPTATRTWSTPKVSSAAVTLVRISYVQSPGQFDEWAVEAIAHGRAAVSSVGLCADCRLAQRRFRVMFVVAGG